jgi:CheY-like chemotaxis protein
MLRSFTTPGLGLLGLKERARHIGGDLFIHSVPGRGSKITVSIPSTFTQALPKEPDVLIKTQDSPASGRTHAKSASTIRVMLVDDHQVMRQGLVRLFSAQPDIQIAGEAANGQEAVELAQQIKPDAILIDISMPRMDGIEATRLIKSRLPAVRIIGLSMHGDEPAGRALIEAGAEALVNKTASSADLLSTIYGSKSKQPAVTN